MKYKIILGSKSPRRSELFRNLITEFEVRTKEVEEIYPEDMAAEDVAKYLADLKANAYSNELAEDEIVICADTTVVIDNQILGKPNNKAEAIRFIQQLAGKTHEVITGVCIFSNAKKSLFDSVTKVYFNELSAEEIQFYVDNYSVLDKAGAYAIQEWIGMIGIQKIEGDYFNVVGLPLVELYRELKKWGIEMVKM